MSFKLSAHHSIQVETVGESLVPTIEYIDSKLTFQVRNMPNELFI